MGKASIYLDNHATTPTDRRVLDAILPYFTEHFANAASRHHRPGRQADEAVQEARAQVAALIGADPREIVFTSGATEANNLALKGVAGMEHHRGDHLVTQATEHHAVLDPLKRLQGQGFRVTVLPVDRHGRVTPEQVEEVLTDRTLLVSVMAANNEVGTLQPIRDIGRLCKERGVLFHTDAVQAAGKLPLDVEEIGADLLSLSAHKMYGPKGVGALYVRRRNPHVRLEPLFDGGGHERGMRSGTLAVPLIVGFGVACELSRTEGPAEVQRLQALRDRLQAAIMGELEGVALNGHPAERLPNNLNLSFEGVKGEALLMALDAAGVAVSSGSACTSASVEPSYVLRAMGVEDELAHASIRFGVGRFNTEDGIDRAAGEVVRAVHRLRAMNPLATVS